MLFLVPDSIEKTDATAPLQDASENTDAANDVGPSGADTFSSESDAKQNAAVKVDLDLDDAPFLDDEPEEEEQEEAPAPPKAPASTKTEKETADDPDDNKIKGFFQQKKRLLILAILALTLIVCSAFAFVFLFFTESPDPDPTPAGPKVIVVNSTTGASEITLPYTDLVKLAPFIIPHFGSEGEVRFLRCTLAIPFDDPVQAQEIQSRMLEIRDALYYFMVNRSTTLLQTEEESWLFKEDLLRVLNEHISIKKLTDIYIQEYAVTGL